MIITTLNDDRAYTYQWASAEKEHIVQIPVDGGDVVTFSATQPSSWLGRYQASGLTPAEPAALPSIDELTGLSDPAV